MVAIETFQDHVGNGVLRRVDELEVNLKSQAPSGEVVGFGSVASMPIR